MSFDGRPIHGVHSLQHSEERLQLDKIKKKKKMRIDTIEQMSVSTLYK